MALSFLAFIEHWYDQHELKCMFFACEVWSIPDVSSVSPSSEETAPKTD